MDMEQVLTDCFWCGTLYEKAAYNRCPGCSTTVEMGVINITDAQTAEHQVTDQ